MIVISPPNATGAYLASEELHWLGRTLVHPGYLFDAEQPAVALSLPTAPETFAAGIARLVAALQHEHPGDAV